MEKIELRVLTSELSVSDDEMIVEGLVNETESWSHTLGNAKRFREKISKGTFERAINNVDRIDFLAEHRADMILATTENSSLQLWEDEEGLKMRAKIAPTSYGKDFYTLIKEKIINHMSFGFRVLHDSWSKAVDGIYERSVDDIVLKEVSIVRNPAYQQSAVSARGIEIVEDVEIPDLEETLDDEERSIDIDTLKSDIVKEVLAGVKTFMEENKAEDTVVEQIEEVVEETTTTEDIVEEVVQAEEAVEEVVEETVEEPKTDEINEDTQVIDEPVQTENEKDGIIDLLDKYKELQNLK